MQQDNTNILPDDCKVGIIGSGSWATAIAKMVMCNKTKLNWYVRNQKDIDLFSMTGSNPKYLTSVKFDTSKIFFSNNINEIVRQSDVLIFAIPSAFLKSAMQTLTEDMSHKFVISAIKGLIPDENMIVGSWINKNLNVPIEHIGVISVCRCMTYILNTHTLNHLFIVK